MPADVRACFDQLSSAPKAGDKVVEVIGKLRISEVRLSRCGKRLLAFYDGLKK